MPLSFERPKPGSEPRKGAKKGASRGAFGCVVAHEKHVKKRICANRNKYKMPAAGIEKIPESLVFTGFLRKGQ